MSIKASDIFVPGGYPTYTYVQRANNKIETTLKDSLEEIGKFVSVSGPSKSGKTVLIEKVVGKESLISITGAGLGKAEEIWSRVLDWMDVPMETIVTTQSVTGSLMGTGGLIEGGIPFLGKGSVTLKAEKNSETSNGHKVTRHRRGLAQVVSELSNSNFVILLDDFHYIPKEIQIEVMRQIKEVVRQGVKMCVASVLHRADEAIRANQEMQGRFTVIDINYWSTQELEKIAHQGFDKIGLKVPDKFINRLSEEAAGSPQLMQTLCLEACRKLDHRMSVDTPVSKNPSDEDMRIVLEDAAQTMDFRSLVDVLDCGPKERGRERKVYGFKGDGVGDVYRCILKSIALDPPRLTFSYDELLGRASQLCDGEPPSGSSLQGSCEQMIRLAFNRFPNERQIDWNKAGEVLDIAEPYLLFYLRWSGRLNEPNE